MAGAALSHGPLTEQETCLNYRQKEADTRVNLRKDVLSYSKQVRFKGAGLFAGCWEECTVARREEWPGLDILRMRRIY
jgi:hypothetical protein